MGTNSAPAAGTKRSPGRLYLALGIGLMLLGPALYVVQIWARLLRTPWYAPILATAAGALLLIAVVQKRNVWRIATLAFCVLFAGFLWHFLLVQSKLPTYHGPVATGASFPTFATILADGSPFNQDSLRGEQNTAMVFFRGRW